MSSAKKYLEGAICAYGDCADLADKIAASQTGFAKFAEAAGLNAHDAEIAAWSGETVARKFAQSLREKAALLRLELEQAAVSPANHGRSAGGRARAAKLSPERRSEIAKAAAAKRWKASVQ